MKALLLAAGFGERMRPLTEHTPKPLLQAGGQALIDYHLQRCKAAGVTEVVINHAWLGAQIEAHIGDGASFGLRVQYSAEGEPLETLGGILRALPLLGPEFFVINSDIWSDFALQDLRLPAHYQAQIVLVDNPPQHPQGDFALQDGRAVADAETRLTFAGIARYRAEFFADLKQGKAPLAPLLREKMRACLVGAQHYRGHWFDIGTPQRLQQLDQFLRAQDLGAQDLRAKDLRAKDRGV